MASPQFPALGDPGPGRRSPDSSGGPWVSQEDGERDEQGRRTGRESRTKPPSKTSPTPSDKRPFSLPQLASLLSAPAVARTRPPAPNAPLDAHSGPRTASRAESGACRSHADLESTLLSLQAEPPLVIPCIPAESEEWFLLTRRCDAEQEGKDQKTAARDLQESRRPSRNQLSTRTVGVNTEPPGLHDLRRQLLLADLKRRYIRKLLSPTFPLPEDPQLTDVFVIIDGKWFEPVYLGRLPSILRHHNLQGGPLCTLPVVALYAVTSDRRVQARAWINYPLRPSLYSNEAAVNLQE